MFVTNYPRGYTKVGFSYSQTKKIASKSPQNSSMFEITAFCGDKAPRNRHEIAASLHGRFGIATKIACVNGPLVIPLRAIRLKKNSFKSVLSFVSQCSHLRCRLRRFDCLLQVFIRR